MKKRLLGIFLGLIVLIPACAQINESQIVEIIPTETNVRLLGRSVIENQNVLMCYSSTGVEFNIKAKRLDVSFIGDSKASLNNEESNARVAVFVNGERKLDKMISEKFVTYSVFEEENFIEGVVQILKISESANSVVALKSISVDKDAEISPTNSSNLKIEFIGDSITCGYGVDDLVSSHHFKTSTEDNTKTYAYKTAKALNADYSMVCLSGWGVVSGYTGNGSKNTISVLPPQYEKLGYSYGSSILGKTPQARVWDFSRFKPDYVVVNLGTNDWSYVSKDKNRKPEFQKGYFDFLTIIRRHYPDAYIICTLGIMGGDLFKEIEIAVEDFSRETGDLKISTLKFNNQNMADGIAADWHPSEKTHEKAANLLVQKIKSLEE